MKISNEKRSELNLNLLADKRRERKQILKFIKYKYSALFFAILKNREKASKLWIKAVFIYHKKTSFFFAKEHDFLLEKIILKLSKQYYISTSYFFPTKKENVLYLLSNIFNSGGHTRVVYDFVSHHDKQKYKFFSFSTEVAKNYTSKNSKYFSLIKENVIDFFISEVPQDQYEQKIEELINYIKKNEIGTIISFEHNYDLAAIISLVKLRENKGLNLIYYHHNNTELSVVPNIFNTFIEISNELMPFYKKHYRNVRFIEIPCISNIKKQSILERRKSNESFVLMTALPKHKMFHNHSVIFLDFVKFILTNITNTNYLIVSNLDKIYLDFVTDYFKEAKLLQRITIKNNISDLSTLFNEYDVYIDSVPVLGGKTIIEMMELEKPCIIYDGKEAAFKQNDSLNFIKVKTKDELLERIRLLKNNSVFYREYCSNYKSFVEKTFNVDRIIREVETLI